MARGDGAGVVLQNRAKVNTIGGTTAGARDVISGNTQSGVILSGAGTSNNVIVGDFIGTDATGSKAVGNASAGVVITNGASGNTVGGSTAGMRDVISGNGLDGVQIEYAGTTSNAISGDDIGTDYTGRKPLGNGKDGVIIANGASANTVGGMDPQSHLGQSNAWRRHLRLRDDD